MILVISYSKIVIREKSFSLQKLQKLTAVYGLASLLIWI